MIDISNIDEKMYDISNNDNNNDVEMINISN